MRASVVPSMLLAVEGGGGSFFSGLGRICLGLLAKDLLEDLLAIAATAAVVATVADAVVQPQQAPCTEARHRSRLTAAVSRCDMKAPHAPPPRRARRAHDKSRCTGDPIVHQPAVPNTRAQRGWQEQPTGRARRARGHGHELTAGRDRQVLRGRMCLPRSPTGTLPLLWAVP